MISNDHNKDEQKRGKFQTNHNVLEIKVICSRLTYLTCIKKSNLQLLNACQGIIYLCKPKYTTILQLMPKGQKDTKIEMFQL